MHYLDLSLSTDDNIVNEASLIIYSEDKTTKFTSSKINISSIEAFDITGRLLFEEKNINALTFEKNIPQTNQTIFITVTLENSQKIRKKLIL